MTLCAVCCKDRAVGGMTARGWECGGCNPAVSVAMMRNRGNGMHRNDRRPRRQYR